MNNDIHDIFSWFSCRIDKFLSLLKTILGYNVHLWDQSTNTIDKNEQNALQPMTQ